jgi:chaperonin GroEL
LSKLAREVTFESDLQAGIEKGLEKAFNVAKAAYGPMAGNLLLEQNYGNPLLSRDGVTNVKRLYLHDAVENMVVRAVVEASSKSNRTAGDGTTLVIILTCALYWEARKLVAAGYNRMEVSRMLTETGRSVVEQVRALSKEVDDTLLEHVCRVSAGDAAIGSMVADVVKQVGPNGGVTLENSAATGIYADTINGFHFNRGFTSLQLVNDASNLMSRHQDVPILICEKRLAMVTDIAPLLDRIASAGIQELVIIGELGPEPLELLLLNRMKGIISCVPIEPPSHEAMRTLFMDDLALVTGAHVIKPGANGADFDVSMLGYAGTLTATEFATTITSGDGASEDVSLRVTELQKQLEEATAEVTINALRDRISRLTGRVGIIKVGGTTEVEQAETKLRVEDCVCAAQAAMKAGIVPGGGTALARVKVDHFKDAFKRPFLELCANAGTNGERLLGQIEVAKDWRGFDLRNLTMKPVDLLDSGVVDPTLVITEAVSNATSVASSLITTTAALTFVDRDVKSD